MLLPPLAVAVVLRGLSDESPGIEEGESAPMPRSSIAAAGLKWL